MISIRTDKQIHDVSGEWFRARWHFSFDTYRDPEYDGFGAMRVFNDDRLIPGAVWPLHPHRDVEGLTYVVEGTFRHEDDAGGAPGPLPAGSVQRMTLGSGALHSEQNASETEPMRFIQIWILPDAGNLRPEVEQRVFTKQDRTDRLLKVVGPAAESGEFVKVHQNASVYVVSLAAGVEVVHPIGPGRGTYAYLIRGAASFGDKPAITGAAARVTGEPEIRLRASEPSELILVDVPMQFEPVGIWRGRLG
jgi:redox-sensitive bicupin YhaK (pirin superfamily)